MRCKPALSTFVSFYEANIEIFTASFIVFDIAILVFQKVQFLNLNILVYLDGNQ